MHLTIITIGTRGDILPYLALGLGLQRAGYRVRIAAQVVYADLIGAYGFEFAPIAGDPRATMDSASGQAWQQSGRNALALIKSMRAVFTGEDMTASLNDALKACQGTQAILYAFFGTAGYHIARKLGIPSIFTLLQPFSRSHEVPSLGFPDLPLGRFYNWLTHRITEQMLWQLGGRPINRWRQETVGLPALPASGPFAQVYRNGEPHLYGFSHHVVPRPSDWPPSHRISGYWFLDPDPGWEPPGALRDFLARRPKPIAIGFGSMSGETARTITRTTLEAVRLTGVRAVLLGGWAAAHRETLPDGVLALDYVPHRWLFSRVAAVVHHGGAGTTAAGLRAGIPSVLVPFFGDQPYWGRRVHALGVGPRPVQARQLTPKRLARAISEAVGSPEIAAAAAVLGERIRVEDGVARGVELVAEMLK